MRLGVVGAGAIGGVLGARLALAGEDVTLVVRNPAHRAAIEKFGLTFIEANGETKQVARPRVVAEAARAGALDVVILSVKAQQIAGALSTVCGLLGPETAVLTLQNGVPWWYFQRHGGPYDGRRLAALDPDGSIEQAIPATRILGAVAYIAGTVPEPGIVRHGGGNRLPFGELDGSQSARANALSQALARAGFDAPILADIRAELWFKAWGNACFNSLCALSHASVGTLTGYPVTRALVVAMMEEQRQIAEQLGVRFPQTIDARIAIVEKVARHKPSMLQDVEAGRAIEIEALVGSVVELGRLVGVATPHFDAIYACAKLLDSEMRHQGVGFAPRAAAP